MIVKHIDKSACEKCGTCASVCVNSKVISMGDDGYPVFERDVGCIHCGHCLSICPAGAISFEPAESGRRDTYFAPALDLGEAAEGPGILLNALRTTRSCRFFDDRSVERSKLELILESMIRSPSAGNEQNRNFYVFDAKAKVDGLESATAAYYRAANARLAAPLAVDLFAIALAGMDPSRVRMRNRATARMTKPERRQEYKRLLSDLAARSASGDMRYYNGAAAAVVVTSCTNTPEMHKSFYKSDVEIAITYGVLAATALGLSSCRMGLSEMAFSRDKSMGAAFGIPSDERVDGILAIGYSSLEWKRIPPRGPVKAIWA